MIDNVRIKAQRDLLLRRCQLWAAAATKERPAHEMRVNLVRGTHPLPILFGQGRIVRISLSGGRKSSVLLIGHFVGNLESSLLSFGSKKPNLRKLFFRQWREVIWSSACTLSASLCGG
jgi:hypothetical protein